MKLSLNNQINDGLCAINKLFSCKLLFIFYVAIGSKDYDFDNHIDKQGLSLLFLVFIRPRDVLVKSDSLSEPCVNLVPSKSSVLFSTIFISELFIYTHGILVSTVSKHFLEVYCLLFA